MIAIINVSPLIYLAQLNLLQFLPNLFDEIWTTRFVEKELLSPPIQPDQVLLTQAFKKWNKIVNPTDLKKIDQFCQLNLHKGEASIIALRLEYNTKKNIIIVDDLAAREVAKTLNLAFTGTLGLLIRFVKKKLITKDACLTNIKKLNLETTFRMNIELLYYIQDIIKNL